MKAFPLIGLTVALAAGLAHASEPPVIVEASGECQMTETITPRFCKDLALSRAKQHAVEAAGSSLVHSRTRLHNNELITDDVSIQSLATIQALDVLDARFIGHGDAGRYVTTIRALVQPRQPAREPEAAVTFSFAKESQAPLSDSVNVATTDTRTHVVQAGETVYQISRTYGISVDKIRKLNKLPDNSVEVGMTLIVSR